MLLHLRGRGGNLRFALLGDGEEEVIGARFLLIDEDIYVHMYRQVSLFSLSAVVRLQKEIGLAEYGEARRPAGTGKQELACSRSLLACGRFVGIDCRTNRCPLSCCKFLSGLQHSDRISHGFRCHCGRRAGGITPNLQGKELQHVH